jgi:hypothetical protein
MRTLDAREIDGEPFGEIVAALERLPAEGTLELVNSFEPEPLYDVLDDRGFAHETERIADGRCLPAERHAHARVAARLERPRRPPRVRFDLVRVRVAPTHQRASAINAALREAEAALVERGELPDPEGNGDADSASPSTGFDDDAVPGSNGRDRSRTPF